jgi:hypothetical protein
MTHPSEVGVKVPQILLPKAGIDLQKWSVIAVDQFTSQPEYWEAAEREVGKAPSTLRLVLPEIYLGTNDEERLIQSTQTAMQAYMAQGYFEPYEGFILVERTTGGHTRRGLMLALDLERYDFNKGAQSLIRATEGTILDRLPPRMKIRRGAALELPHILVLIDDAGRTVIEPLYENKGRLPVLYDFDLMLGSGHLKGYAVQQPELVQQVINALGKLADPQAFRSKYAAGSEQDVLLFAMGDGNHSLATAKAVWDEMKANVGSDHPARYALVEIENVHDEGLLFEPIHRVLFGISQDLTQALHQFYGEKVEITCCSEPQEMFAFVQKREGEAHTFGIIEADQTTLVSVCCAESNLAVGTLQPFLDYLLANGGAERIDYVHGDDVVQNLGSQPGNAGFYLPGMDKSDLFKTVIVDGALPRKTFSMGEAREKRFYLEARGIAD